MSEGGKWSLERTLAPSVSAAKCGNHSCSKSTGSTTLSSESATVKSMREGLDI